MTEAEWLEGSGLDAPVDYLVTEARASERKLRLFACACCRHCRRFPGDHGLREAVGLMERFADGLLGEGEYPRYNTFTHDVLTCAVAHGVRRGLPPARRGGGDAAFRCAVTVSGGDPEGARALCALLRDIFGNPFRPVTLDPSWVRPNVTGLARSIYDERPFGRMPELAVALENAGGTNEDVLAHCRGGGEHVRGCWVVDLILGKS